MVETKTKAEPSTGKGQKLLTHIVKRKPNGLLEDKALCGALWDRVFNKSASICKDCKDIAQRDGHNWRAS